MLDLRYKTEPLYPGNTDLNIYGEEAKGTTAPTTENNGSWLVEDAPPWIRDNFHVRFAEVLNDS